MSTDQNDSVDWPRALRFYLVASLVALIMFGSPAWPAEGSRKVLMASLTIGIGYTIYSEWVNTSVRSSWAYSDFMPVVPLIGTGLSPLLQWIVVPTLSLWVAIGRAPWIDWRESDV